MVPVLLRLPCVTANESVAGHKGKRHAVETIVECANESGGERRPMMGCGDRSGTISWCCYEVADRTPLDTVGSSGVQLAGEICRPLRRMGKFSRPWEFSRAARDPGRPYQPAFDRIGMLRSAIPMTRDLFLEERVLAADC